MKLRIVKTSVTAASLTWLVCLFVFCSNAEAKCGSEVAAASAPNSVSSAVNTEVFKKVLELLTLLKELFSDDDDAQALQAAILKDPAARSKFPGLKFVFDRLDHSVFEMGLQTNLGGISQFSAEGRENSGSQDEAEAIGIVKSYLKVLEIPFDTVKEKNHTKYLVVPNANGHPIQKLAHQIAESTHFRIGIDSDIKRIGYLSPGEKVLHLGLQALFLPDPRYSVVLQHELAHLNIMHFAGEKFSIFGGALRSRKGTIQVPGYTRFFHLSELAAAATGVSVGLVNLLRLQNVWADPQFRMDLVVDEIRSQLSAYIYNLWVNIELISSVVVRLDKITKLESKVTAAGIQFSFENATERPSRFAFNRGFISVRPSGLAPNGTLTLQAGDISFDVPLPVKYRLYLRKLMDQIEAGKLTPDKLGNSISRLLAILRNQFLEIVPEMMGSLDLVKIHGDARDRYLACDKILLDIKHTPASLLTHLQKLQTFHETFDEEADNYSSMYNWSSL